MCDPLFEDCPTEEPTGPSLADLMQPRDEKVYTDGEILEANLFIMGAALTATIYFAVDAFVIQSNNVTKGITETLYKSVVSSTTSWITANSIKNYLGLAIFATALITQIMGMLGIATSLNKMIWQMGVQLGSLGLVLIYGLMLWLAREDVHTAAVTPVVANSAASV